jgi:hypothetical protein
MKVVPLKEKVQNNAKWPIDSILKRLDDFDEVLVLAKIKGEEGYAGFSSKLKSTFWWVGVMEAMKRNLMDESLELTEKGDG